MKKTCSLIIAAIALLGLHGCRGSAKGTVATSPQAVRFVTDRSLVAGCGFLGQVAGSSSLGGIAAQKWGKARSEEEMMKKAARLGANVVLVNDSRGGFMGAESSGEAYLCGAGAPAPAARQVPVTEAPAAGQAGCVKDTDCKGDRICEYGRCVDP